MSSFSMEALFGVFLTEIIGLALLPTVIEFANASRADYANASAAARALITLIPLFYVIILLAIPAAAAFLAFKRAR